MIDSDKIADAAMKLALLYLQNQKISNLTPENLFDKYVEVVEKIENYGMNKIAEHENELKLYEKQKLEMVEVIEFVVDAGQVSTSLLQRGMKVSYTRAGQLIEEMEKLGIIGPHNGSKPREVLITYKEWLDMKENFSIKST